jgi:hypothetical protein
VGDFAFQRIHLADMEILRCRQFELILLFLLWLGCFAAPFQAQSRATSLGSSSAARISGFRIERTGSEPGPLLISINGSERQVADKALNAWLIHNGHQLVYSGEDGAGGYENEGQSLRLYDPQTGESRKILSEYFSIDSAKEVEAAGGKRVILVGMRDSGLGASHLAVVDPERGEVFAARKARLLSCKDDTIVLGYYRDADWEAMARGQAVSPVKTERYNLTRLLKRPLIVNAQAPRD